MPSILTIVTPAASAALTDVNAAQAELGLDGTEDITYIQQQIAAASAAIASWCGRTFAREVLREVWRDVSWQEVVSLSRYPVASIASVVADGETLAAEDYECDIESGMLYRLSADERTRWTARKLTVNYTAGYILPGNAGRNLPHDVQRACILMVAAQHNARGRDPLLRSESAQDVGQVSYLDPRAGMEAMPPQAAALLAPYRAFTV
jgi:hypothetical protein